MMRTAAFVLAVILMPATAVAFCLEPSPKACNEFFKSDAVVIGTVFSKQSAPETQGFDEGWIYRIRVHRNFRGTKADEVSVFTENNSGRMPLTVNHEYLLFAKRVRGRLQIDGCGNSGLAAQRQRQIHVIENVANGRTRIEGRVVARASWMGIADARFEVVGEGRNYSAVTNEGGTFSVEVAPGSYAVSAKSDGIAPFDLTYDDPAHVMVERGQCAQVQFILEDELKRP